MKKLLTTSIIALLIAALLCPLALMEDIASEAVDEPVEVSDAVELTDESGDELLEAQAEPVAPDMLPEGDADGIPIDEAHFPDPMFRKYIAHQVDYQSLGLSQHMYDFTFDTNKDGFLSETERTAVEKIFLWGDVLNRDAKDGLGITSVKGIEYFPNLKILEAFYNPITTIDVSKLTNLVDLNCADCNLTALDVSGLSKLEYLNCAKCNLSSLNLSGCSSIDTLVLHTNQLTSLDLSDCVNVMHIIIEENPLTSLDVSKCRFFAQFPKGFSTTKYKGSNRVDHDRSLTKEELQTVVNTVHFVTMQRNRSTKIISAKGSTGGSSAPAVPASFTNSSEGVTVAVDASSTARNTVAAVVATPGSVTQLDLSGATGKKFKSSNKKVATVNKNGVVTFKGPGKVKITYKVGKKTRKVTLTVTDPTFPATIALNLVGTMPAKVGEPQTLVATLNDGAVSGIKWKSNKKKVATVNNGVVTFKKAGTVTITATTTRGKKKASVTFNVAK